MNELPLSILTATYNRAHTLPRVWRSLNAQASKAFEWVIVDDGSTDRTKELVAGWAAESVFPIRYTWKPNGGKNSALNVGKELISGKYVFVLDSDDALLDDAVQLIDEYKQKTNIDSLPDVSGLAFLCVDENGDRVGPGLPMDFMRCCGAELHYRYRVRSELAGITKSEIYRSFHFPELPPPEHCPESVAYSALWNKFDAFYINKPIRRYFIHDGEQRLSTKQGEKKGSIASRGKYFHRRSVLNNDMKWFWCDPKLFLKCATDTSRFGFHIDRSVTTQYEELTKLSAKLLWVASLLRGYRKYRRDLREKQLA